jgi:phosphoribosylformimino-5-aminoimidazole carboxamide ribotide isomerase
MIILPAIDIHNGKCVRLYKGDFSTSHVVADDYMTTALNFEKSGAEWIHMVDLDGAKAGHPVNDKIFSDVASKTNLKVELGGGIRTFEDIEKYFDKGISRVILGSVALKNPELVEKAVDKFGEKIAVGIDAKNDFVAVDGWINCSEIHFVDLAKKMESIGVKNIIYTDISKDGTLSGVSDKKLKLLNDSVRANVIASGGVTSMDDIVKCNNLNLYGAICGKSLYEKTLDLKEAIDYCRGV